MTFAKYMILLVVVAGVSFALWIGVAQRSERQWFELQRQQLVEIERLGAFPPQGWDVQTWRNALVTPYNVWGNVTYHPDYSQISNEEMRELTLQLEEIVSKTTTENSLDSVDQVFQLLLQRGQKVEFISEYRQEFLAFRDSVQVKK